MSDMPFGSYPPRGLVTVLTAMSRRQGMGWLDKRLAFLMRRLAILLLRGAPVDTTLWGMRMRLYPYNNVCEKRMLFTPQYFDAAEREYLGRHIDMTIAGGQPYFFLDIGANVGGYALFAASQAKKQGRILAVEPQPEIFDRLCFNIAANPDSGIKAIAAALSDSNGEVTLFLDKHNKGETSMKLVGFEPGHENTITVPARTLMHLLMEEGFTTLDGLKLDVEGAEDLILMPFFRDAPPSVWPRLIIIEDGRKHWQSNLLGMLKSSGYSQVLQTRLNLVFERPS